MARYGLRLREQRRRRRALGHGSKHTSDACGRRWFAHRWLPMRTKLKQKQPSKPAFVDSSESGSDSNRRLPACKAFRCKRCADVRKCRSETSERRAVICSVRSAKLSPGSAGVAILRALPFRSRIALRHNDFWPSSLARRSLVLPRSSQRRATENTTHDLRRSGAPRIALGSAYALRLTELVVVSRLTASTPARGKGGVQPSGYRWT